MLRILLVQTSQLPALKYGGTERVIWYLAKALSNKGHRVAIMAAPGTVCPFADVIFYQKKLPLEAQLPKHYDLLHFHFPISFIPQSPYIITQHGNARKDESLDPNTVFISKNHALRHQASVYIYNGLDWNDAGAINIHEARNALHFLGKAAWKVKNLDTALRLAREAKKKIHILGGNRLNLNMGFRFTTDLNAIFYGMVGGAKKWSLLQKSNALLFPVLWDEPFGLAIIESLYAGCQVIGSSYGSVPELINTPELGMHSTEYEELLYAVKHVSEKPSKFCHEYARENFNHIRMADGYEKIYEKVIRGIPVHINSPNLSTKPEGYSIIG